jgi:hypothetical protein
MPPGDWRVRSVHSEEAGREDRAPKSTFVAKADAVVVAEGSIWAAAKARLPGVAGVCRPGHAFKWISHEPRKISLSLPQYGHGPAQPKTDQVPGA